MTTLLIVLFMKATVNTVAVKPKDFEIPTVWYVTNKFHK